MDTSLDHERCYRAVASRDARFDGAFYTAVRTTGIYCRPSCPAITPKRGNVSFFRTPAAAQREGYRACRRCRPDAVPGSAEWNVRGDLVGRVMRLIADGAVERSGVAGLATALGYSERHLNRIVTEELGAGVLAIARSQRAHIARTLLETTDLSAAEVAWASGFGSIRSFNDTIATVYGEAPTRLRRRVRDRSDPADSRGSTGPAGSAQGGSGSGERGRRDQGAARPTGHGSDGVVEPVGTSPGGQPTGSPTHAPITVRLPTRQPFDAQTVLAFLGERAIEGVESWDGSTYRRTLRLPHGHATVGCRAGAAGVVAQFRLADLRDLAPAVTRVRRMLDLDADPAAIAEVLGADPLVAGLVAARPGLRMAGTPDPHEIVVRAIVGQQVSVAGARTVVGRFVSSFGEPLDVVDPELSRVFPTVDRLAGADPTALSMPRTRGAALVGVCQALAGGDLVLDAGVDRAETMAELQRHRGIGPWTAAYVAMRGLGDPDVLLAGDLGVRHAVAALGGDARPPVIERAGRAWRPWRSYAVAHLWASLGGPPAPGPPPGPPPGSSAAGRS